MLGPSLVDNVTLISSEFVMKADRLNASTLVTVGAAWTIVARICIAICLSDATLCVTREYYGNLYDYWARRLTERILELAGLMSISVYLQTPPRLRVAGG